MDLSRYRDSLFKVFIIASLLMVLGVILNISGSFMCWIAYFVYGPICGVLLAIEIERRV